MAGPNGLTRIYVYDARSGRTTVATIHLGALRHNLARLKVLAAPAKVMAVVKADAYGHGAVDCACALEEEGEEPE